VSEDAVAPVVAAMLILAVVVTFFAAWNAYYVPSMKAQSEISHIKDVESGFMRFSSDIEAAASLKKNMRLSEQIPLGGGDFTFDSVKSGGELHIWDSLPSGYVQQDWTSQTEPGNPAQSFGLVKFTYKPVNNFWQEQGYGWMNGNVYVLNTERNLSTPLLFYNSTDITYDLAGSLVELEAVPSYSSPGNCSSIIVHTINIAPDSRHFQISGNGNGMLALESTVNSERILNATSLNINITAPPGRFGTGVWDSVNASAGNTLAICGNVKRIVPDNPDQQKLQLIFETDPYPNMTLVRETTEISIGAY
jgi:hypothetical protein